MRRGAWLWMSRPGGPTALWPSSWSWLFPPTQRHSLGSTCAGSLEVVIPGVGTLRSQQGTAIRDSWQMQYPTLGMFSFLSPHLVFSHCVLRCLFLSGWVSSLFPPHPVECDAGKKPASFLLIHSGSQPVLSRSHQAWFEGAE